MTVTKGCNSGPLFGASVSYEINYSAQSQRRSYSAPSQRRSYSARACYICGRTGHMQADCPSRRPLPHTAYTRFSVRYPYQTYTNTQTRSRLSSSHTRSHTHSHTHPNLSSRKRKRPEPNRLFDDGYFRAPPPYYTGHKANMPRFITNTNSKRIRGSIRQQHQRRDIGGSMHRGVAQPPPGFILRRPPPPYHYQNSTSALQRRGMWRAPPPSHQNNSGMRMRTQYQRGVPSRSHPSRQHRQDNRRRRYT